MFKQLRIGLNGKDFKCNKFRSMNLDAEKNGAQFACIDDTRVFAFGEFMRKTRIDELPQMLNVFKGEMHLIGPRPERKIWTDKFEEIIPYYNERHLVRPGITGWAQVMYPYGENAEDAKQKLMYDLYYIKHWSLLLELKIVYKTIMVVLGRKGL
jgi:lipopolysaccharide/colanic/teichoic acid biosynthesis glycosyltransferase